MEHYAVEHGIYTLLCSLFLISFFPPISLTHSLSFLLPLLPHLHVLTYSLITTPPLSLSFSLSQTHRIEEKKACLHLSSCSWQETFTLSTTCSESSSCITGQYLFSVCVFSVCVFSVCVCSVSVSVQCLCVQCLCVQCLCVQCLCVQCLCVQCLCVQCLCVQCLWVRLGYVFREQQLYNWSVKYSVISSP